MITHLGSGTTIYEFAIDANKANQKLFMFDGYNILHSLWCVIAVHSAYGCAAISAAHISSSINLNR